MARHVRASVPMGGKKKKAKTPGLLGDNRKARFLYAIEDTLECGIELRGSEVKSIKAAKFDFSDAFIEASAGQLTLRNFSITPYNHASLFNHRPDRPRQLLAHKKEILKLERRVNERGFTLIPLKFYLVQGRVKVELALCRGKKMVDKRQSVKLHDIQRDMERDFRNR